MAEVAKRLVKEEAGQGLVEYAMIISLIVIVVIVALPGLGNALASMYNDIAAAFIP